eukprot:Opistho-2@74589
MPEWITRPRARADRFNDKRCRGRGRSAALLRSHSLRRGVNNVFVVHFSTAEDHCRFADLRKPKLSCGYRNRLHKILRRIHVRLKVPAVHALELLRLEKDVSRPQGTNQCDELWKVTPHVEFREQHIRRSSTKAHEGLVVGANLDVGDSQLFSVPREQIRCSIGLVAGLSLNDDDFLIHAWRHGCRNQNVHGRIVPLRVDKEARNPAAAPTRAHRQYASIRKLTGVDKLFYYKRGKSRRRLPPGNIHQQLFCLLGGCQNGQKRGGKSLQTEDFVWEKVPESTLPDAEQNRLARRCMPPMDRSRGFVKFAQFVLGIVRPFVLPTWGCEWNQLGRWHPLPSNAGSRWHKRLSTVKRGVSLSCRVVYRSRAKPIARWYAAVAC